jgi:NifU-like protein involved in Fe-S cluster formation
VRIIKYSKAFQDHFLQPRHVGEMDHACGTGSAIHEKDGDRITVYVRIEEGKIQIRFLVRGCPRIIASASALAVLVNGKTPEEAMAVREEAIREALELPDPSFQCPAVPIEAFHRALAQCGYTRIHSK